MAAAGEPARGDGDTPGARLAAPHKREGATRRTRPEVATRPRAVGRQPSARVRAVRRAQDAPPTAYPRTPSGAADASCGPSRRGSARLSAARGHRDKLPARGLARRLARPGCGGDLATPPARRQAASLSQPCLGGYHWLRTETSPTAASRTAPLVRPPRSSSRPRRRAGRPQAGTRQIEVPRPRLLNAYAVGLCSALLRSAPLKRGFGGRSPRPFANKSPRRRNPSGRSSPTLSVGISGCEW